MEQPGKRRRNERGRRDFSRYGFYNNEVSQVAKPRASRRDDPSLFKNKEILIQVFEEPWKN